MFPFDYYVTAYTQKAKNPEFINTIYERDK